MMNGETIHNKPYPLYSQVNTEYLHSLSEFKYVTDVIGNDIVHGIADALLYAKRKHPKFADEVTDMDIGECSERLANVRELNDKSNSHFSCSILEEEFLEAIEQHLLGDKEECIKEIYHTIAVLVRMVEMKKRL